MKASADGGKVLLDHGCGRYTFSPEEALDIASQLADAAEEAEGQQRAQKDIERIKIRYAEEIG